MKSYKAEYYIKNKSRISKQFKAYRSKNKLKIRAKQREWEIANRDGIRERTKKWMIENKEHIAAYASEKYRSNPEPKKARERKRRADNREMFCERDRIYKSKNKHKTNEYYKRRYEDDLVFRVKHLLRTRLNIALKRRCKKGSSVKLLGCSIQEFIKYIEGQFEPWMNWENRGITRSLFKTWQLDHIMPLAKFDLTDPIQLENACHYSNFRPLESFLNLLKSDNVSGEV